MAEHHADQQDDHHRSDVHEKHHETRVFREERMGEHQEHRQARGTRDERHQHAGQHPLTGIGQGAGGRQGRQIAAETDADRQKRATVQSQGAHGAIHHECGTGHVAGILQDRQHQEHDAHHRNERQHGDHAIEHAIDQQRTHPAAVIGHAEQAQQPVEAGCAPAAERHIDPILHRAGQRRRGLEHSEQDRKEHDDADYGVQQHAVDAVGQGDMTIVVDVEATQYAGGPVKAGIGP